MDKTKIVEISRFSTLYPTEFLGENDAPASLYAVGNVQLLKNRKFTVVGSRRTPANALQLGKTVCSELSRVFTVVTGCADGGDLSAVEGALQGEKKVICVLAGGFGTLPQGNLPLLRKVAKEGLLLALHPYDTPVRAFSYEYRNKYIALLGEGALVLGAGEKSGALITAKQVLQRKKPLFAFPYPPNLAVGCGCNRLIKKGAHLTENAEDIFENLEIENIAIAKREVSLTENEEKLLEALQTLVEGHINELSEKTGIPVFKARSLLAALEVKGVVVSLGGNRYAPV